MDIVFVLAGVWIGVAIFIVTLRSRFLSWMEAKLREHAEMLRMRAFMSQESLAEFLRKAGNDKTGE